MDEKQAKYAKYGTRGFKLQATCRRVQNEGITMTPKRAHESGRGKAHYGLVTALHTDVVSKLLSMAKVKYTLNVLLLFQL